jgi:hypothetical protein
MHDSFCETGGVTLLGVEDVLESSRFCNLFIEEIQRNISMIDNGI